MKDNCILCGVETPYDETTHVDMRIGYIEGVGQLCSKCHNMGMGREHITVPTHLIVNTPNDIELGYKIRRIYYER